MAKLSDYFADVLDVDDQRKLTQYCWFCITINLRLQGQEIQVGLKKTDIVFEENGSVPLGIDFLSKNYRAGDGGGEFQSAGRITDPRQVSALRKLLEKSHPDIPRLFRRVHLHWKSSDKVWFMKMALGHNLLSNMMRRISESAGLSRVYTNHRLHATSSTALRKAGFSDRMICSVSGHKNPTSLQAYKKSR